MLRLTLTDTVSRMPDRERLVLTLHYYEGLTFAEIGDVLGLAQSRVRRIHAKGMLHLQKRLSTVTG